MVDKVKKAGERYELIHKFLEDKKDNDSLDFLDSLVENCKNYVNYVVNMEKQIQFIKFRSEEWEMREKIEELDKNRRIFHESLISKLLSFNRYLFKKYDDKIPVGGIFTLDPESIRDRYSVADWAGYLVDYLNSKK